MEYLNVLMDYAVYIMLGLAALVIVLFILYIVNIVQISKLKKRYQIFMTGKDAKSLEDTLVKRLNQVDGLLVSNEENKNNIEVLFKKLIPTYQKCGMVKYDAFHEMGGKLSFSLALLNEENDGFILNAMHSREGCYTYVKEILKGSSYIVLSEEEREALDLAIENKGTKSNE